MLHDGNAAATEFQKFFDRRRICGELSRERRPFGSARAYVLDAAKDPAGDSRARIAYQIFLTLWKDADPDVPVLKEAQAEYAKLQ